MRLGDVVKSLETDSHSLAVSVSLRSPVRENRTPGPARGPLGNWRSYLNDFDMKQLWRFINSPVVVVIEGALLLALLGFIGYKSLWGAFTAGDTKKNRIEALSKIEIISFSEAATGPKETQKFIGKLRNHSPFIVKELQGSVCFYSEDGKLIDVFTNPLDGIGTLAPDGNREFSICLRRDRDASGSEPKVIGYKTEVKLVDATVEIK
jgi:hypothetical protein